MRALQMTVCPRSERRKVHPLRKYTIKDTFRCLITMWRIGIAKRGLNELIFCENLKIYNPKSEKVGTVWKTQIKKVSSDF